MYSIINVNGVSWDIKARYWVLKHVAMICQGLPIFLPDPITSFTIMDGSKVEWAMDKRILMKHVYELPGNYQVMLNRVRGR